MKFLVSERHSTSHLTWINKGFLQIVLLFALFAVICAAPAPKADPNYIGAVPYGYGYSPLAYSYSNVVQGYPSAYAYPSVYSGKNNLKFKLENLWNRKLFLLGVGGYPYGGSAFYYWTNWTIWEIFRETFNNLINVNV